MIFGGHRAGIMLFRKAKSCEYSLLLANMRYVELMVPVLVEVFSAPRASHACGALGRSDHVHLSRCRLT